MSGPALNGPVAPTRLASLAYSPLYPNVNTTTEQINISVDRLLAARMPVVNAYVDNGQGHLVSLRRAALGQSKHPCESRGGYGADEDVFVSNTERLTAAKADRFDPVSMSVVGAPDL